jgi:spore coat polysaccharide biosynthesis predicted glycosyltransferase SpsG
MLNKISKDFTLHVVIGALNVNIDPIIENARKMQECKIYRDISNMEELIIKADIGFVGSGTTLMECCALGLPAVVSPQNDLEARFSAYIESRKSCLVLRDSDTRKNQETLIRNILNSKKIREEMSLCQKSLIDGMGKERIVQIILSGKEHI